MSNQGPCSSGSRDVRRAAQELAAHIPSRLAPLAYVAYNYRWSWTPDGREVFRDIAPHRWRLCRENPVRFLQEAAPLSLERAAGDLSLVARVEALADILEADLARPPAIDDPNGISPEHPVAFFCAEFGVHRSLPVYSGGLGALAGDILKEASDQALPMVGVGLFYQRGFFHQRLEGSGWQQEYWTGTDPNRRPAARVTGSDGRPIAVTVHLWGQDVAVHVWRVDVGRVPLFLLDTELAQNSPRQRFVSARLYEGNRQVRLAQYALLGAGGMRVLEALGIDPALIHLNEGHPALATFELAAREVAAGTPFVDAVEKVRKRVAFTTHTPVPAGNETYSVAEVLDVFPNFPVQLGTTTKDLMGLGRIRPHDLDEPPGMTPLAIRMSRSVNGVSRRHGEVAREMWQPMFPDRPVDAVPITHVTNGAHLATWMAPSIRRLLDRYLVPGWQAPERVTDPATWEAVDSIPDAELWAARLEAKTQMIESVRVRSVTDRLTRGDTLDYAEKAVQMLDPHVVTIGFARRLAAYKRLHLLTHDPERILRLLDGPRPIQILLAGKAHPQDEEAKRNLQGMFGMRSDPRIAGRVSFLEDYHLGLAHLLVTGCDVWLNLPTPPLEASGTSGMKAALNGGLNLSVLDGWWAEAYDGSNGWAIEGDVDPDVGAKNARDAAALYDLLENQIMPLFYDRDADGIPLGWIARIKASLRTIGPRFNASRMVNDYIRGVYLAG